MYHDNSAPSKPGVANFWRQQATASGLPVIPVRIVWNPVKRKHDKLPLTPRGVWDASDDPDVIATFNWTSANGYGIRMGAGLYALDADTYKPGCQAGDWIRSRGITTDTRTHRTVSGGYHLIYRLPEPHEHLRSLTVAPGLDSRGHGSFVAYGAGYDLYDDSEPAWLPVAVCEELSRRAAGAGGVALWAYTEPEPSAFDARINEALWGGPKSLKWLWAGNKLRGDTSGSAKDLAVAIHLAVRGLTRDEIVCALLTRFKHGQCARGAPGALRAAQRCAERAMRAHTERKATVDFVNAEPTEAEHQQMLRDMGNG